MAKSLSSTLYGLSRKIAKIAMTVKDIETVSTLDPKIIAKRVVNKEINKVAYGGANKAIKSIKKKVGL